MYIIDDTFFQREYAIPNTDEPDSVALVELEQFIDERCRLLLRNALGYANFADFDSYLVNGALPPIPEDPTPDPVPIKWRQLVNGYDYTIDDVDYSWAGLTQTLGSYKTSFLVPYVFYYWFKNSIKFRSGVGEAQAKTKNAIHTNPIETATNSWNDFLKKYQGDVFGSPVGNVYHIGIPQIDGYYVDFYGDSPEPNLLQFLNQNAETYPDCELRRYSLKNQLAL